MFNTANFARDILAAYKADAEGTWGPDADKGHGYFVGGACLPSIHGVGDHVPGDLSDFARVAQFVLNGGASQHLNLGMWIDNGIHYTDASNWIEDRETAISVGRARGELAIWDVENGEEIRL